MSVSRGGGEKCRLCVCERVCACVQVILVMARIRLALGLAHSKLDHRISIVMVTPWETEGWDRHSSGPQHIGN